MQPAYELPKEVIQKLTNKLINFLDKHKAVFDERVLLETIIETHGDLRPEHIYLTSPPVIIDRLEFSRSLRIQDVAEELSYFVMECEMLGNASPGRIFFDVYIKQASDNIHPSLIFFYKIKRACLRAFLVARHITEQNDKRENWIKKANDYLALALEYNRNWQYD